jgi:hypothetical protein
MKSDTYATGDGWYLDDIQLITYPVTVVSGDVNADGTINILDIIRTVNIINSYGEPPTDEEIQAADMNNDGTVDTLDVEEIISIILNE